MGLRDGLVAAFSSAMLMVTFGPRPHAAMQQNMGFGVQVAWLAERESALGDWESVRPPLREGDELQLTVLASEDACVYVLDADRKQLFPPPGAPPTLARVRARWPYAIPGPHQTWRLDAGQHDRLYVVAARHPLSDPASAIGRADASTRALPELELPLRDGRPGRAASEELRADEIVVGRYDAR